MAQLTYNSAKKYRFYDQDQETDGAKPPEQNVRDTLLKKILTLNLRTNIDVDECLKSKSKFVSSLKQEDSTPSSKGLMTSEDYKKVCEESDVKEILSSCGLDEGEINSLLSGMQKRAKESHEAHLQRLKSIEQKIHEKQNYLEDDSLEQFSGAVKLNRHEFEEENRKLVSSKAEKLSSCLIQLESYSDPTVPTDHPINKLSELEKELFPSGLKREGQYSAEAVKKVKGPDPPPPRYKRISETPQTLWDMKETPIFSLDAKDKKDFDKDLDSCEPNKREKKTDLSKPFVWSLDPPSLVPISTVMANRFSIQEIKSDPKFQSYHSGPPTSTLFVKNLPKKVSATVLVSLFGHFEEENGPKNIEYRILKGRMRGQAFVHFNSAEVAAKALSLCNGYIIEGKPIVVEFGKKNHKG